MAIYIFLHDHDNIVGSIQKIEGRLCEMLTYKHEVEKCKIVIEQLSSKVESLEKITSLAQSTEDESLSRKIEILNEAISQKDEFINRLKSELEYKSKEMELLRQEKLRQSSELKSKSTEIEYKTKETETLREENVLIKTHFDKKLKEVEYLQNENTKLKNSIDCNQMKTNIKQNQSVETVNDFEITVPTQNRFSMLEETSPKEDMRVQEQLKIQSKQIDDISKKKQTNLQHPKGGSKDEYDLIIIGDSHIRSLQSRKLYRNKKVKIHTLGVGQKNIAGAKTYFDSLTTTCKHFVVIVGSNDLSRGATVTQVHQDLQDLKELVLSKFKDCVLNISPLFHRIGQRQFNSKIDEINKKLSTLIGKNLHIMTNRHITFRERHLFEPDGVHFNRNGTIELAKIIKENMNEQLGLMTYANYDYNHYEDRYQSYHTYQRESYKPFERDLIFRLLGI